jgi:hypothetical protein
MASLDKRADRLAQVQAQVDYHGRRLSLYRRLHGSHPSARLTELELAYAQAHDRLTGETGRTIDAAFPPGGTGDRLR